MIRILAFGAVPNEEIFSRMESAADVSAVVGEIIADVRAREIGRAHV